MTLMKKVTVVNQMSRGLRIGGVYVPAGGMGEVDYRNEYLQNLVQRRSVVIVEPVAPTAEAEAATEEVAAEEEAEDKPKPARAKKAAAKKTTES